MTAEQYYVCHMYLISILIASLKIESYKVNLMILSSVMFMTSSRHHTLQTYDQH